MIKLQLTKAVENPTRFKVLGSEITIGHEPVDVSEAQAKAIETHYPDWTQRVPVKGQTPTGNENK